MLSRIPLATMTILSFMKVNIRQEMVRIQLVTRQLLDQDFVEQAILEERFDHKEISLLGFIMTLYFHSDGSVVRAGFRIIARAGKSHD